jgi:FG-GAP-like repeat/Secretion system C-terminal sorting domain
MKYGRVQFVLAILLFALFAILPVSAQNFGGWLAPELIDGNLGYASIDIADVNGDAYPDFATIIYANGAPQPATQSLPIFWTYDPDMDMFNSMALTDSYRPDGARVNAAYDMDGDGDDDMIVANLIDNKIGWYDNDGTSGGAAHQIANLISGIHDCQGGDFDNDGDADVVFVSRDTEMFYFASNNGDDTWTVDSYPVPFGYDPDDIEVRDVDNDMDLDVFIANRGLGGVFWAENDGTGTFTLTRMFTAGGGIGAINLLDVDGDGDTDMVASALASNSLILVVQNEGAFDEYVLSNSLPNVKHIRSGDIDGDSDMDIVALAGMDGVIATFEHTSGYLFTRVDVADVLGHPIDLELIDLDQDDDLDFVTVAPGTGIITYETVSLTPFVVKTVMESVGAGREVHADDMDSDGDLDVLVSTLSDDFLLFENLGVDGWLEHELVTGQPTTDFLTMDWDDDGMVDIIAADFSVDELVFWRQTGDLVFERNVLATVIAPEFLDLADFNGDELMDIAVAADAGFYWYEQVTPTTVTPHIINEYVSVNVTMIVAGDFNGDGSPDLISSRTNGPSRFLTLMVNNGIGEFTNFGLDDHLSTSGFFAELSGDELVDITAGYDDELNWYRNNDPGFNIFHLNVQGSLLDHCVADVDVDGDNDMVVLWDALTGLYWMDNDGLGNFTQGSLSPQAGDASVIFCVDMDDDGDEDFVVARENLNGDVVWVENQYADFVTAAPMIATSSSGDVLAPSVDDEQAKADFSMFASPNPFNAATTLQMTLPQAGEMKVQVFNVTGRLVATLANGTYQPGTHRLVWMADNHASGIYFVRATALGQAAQVSKIMLVR